MIGSYWPFLKFALVPALAWISFVKVQRIQKKKLKSAARFGTGFVFALSTLLLILSLPTGSIDISDLWPFLALGLVLLIPCWILALAFRIESRWIKLPLQTVGSLLMIPMVPIILMMCLSQAGCVHRNPPIYSPDGKYLALVENMGQGALGDDYGTVSVRRAWLPTATIAYDGLGSLSLRDRTFIDSPEVHWQDSSHLLIRYWDRRTGKEGRGAPTCRDKIGSLYIVCENMSIPGRE